MNVSAIPFTWSDPAGWTASGELTRTPHGLVVSRLEVTTASPSGVTASILRKVRVGAILTDQYRRTPVQTLDTPPALESHAPRARPGRAPLTQDLLREVAIGYIDENAPGSPPGAMKRLAERFGKPEETVRNWVTRARRDGWLGPSVKGRSGAEPGPLLRGGR